MDTSRGREKGEDAEDVLVRPAGTPDVPPIAALIGELGYPIEPAEAGRRLAPLLDSPHDHLLVAAVEERVTGFAALHRIPLVHRPACLARISALVVADGLRGRGIGSGLLRACEARARLWDAERIEVTSGDARTDAHAFYLGRGFARQGVRFTRWLDGPG